MHPIRITSRRADAPREHRATPAAQYIGRGTPLGNPAVLGRDGDRPTVIRLFEGWLEEQLRRRDPRVCAELRRLYDLAQQGPLELSCWCVPLACHGEVIRDVLLRKARQDERKLASYGEPHA